MGTAHNPKSTRASRGRSDQSLSTQTKPTSRRVSARPRQTPARQKPAESVSPAKALRKILAQLEDICSTVIVVHHALREQNVELDDDAADVLKLHVSDPLYDQILKLKRIVGWGAS